MPSIFWGMGGWNWFCQVCNGRSLAVYLLWPTFDPLFVGTDGTHFLRSLDGGPKKPVFSANLFFRRNKSDGPWGGIPVVSPAGGHRAIHGTTGEATLDTFSSHVHLSGEGEHLGICFFFVLVVGWGISWGKKLKNESMRGGGWALGEDLSTKNVYFSILAQQ